MMERRTPAEQQFLAAIAHLFDDWPLTIQQENLVLDQAREIGDLAS